MSQFVYGKNVVKQILMDDASKCQMIWLAVDDRAIEALAQRNHVRVRHTDKKYLSKVTNSERHQGVAAEIDDYKTYTLDELMRNVPEGEHGLIILCDELEDPHNLGAILRTADAVGATGVIFKKTHAVGLTPTVAKVSVGAIDTVKCCEVTNLNRAVDQLKKKQLVGCWN